MPVLGVGQQHAGKKSAKHHRHARKLHEQRRADDDEQRGGRKQLGDSRGCNRVQNRLERQTATDDQQRQGADHNPDFGKVEAAFNARLRAKQREYRYERYNGEIL